MQTAKILRLLITAGRSIEARLLVRLVQRKGLTATLLVRDRGGDAALQGDNCVRWPKTDTILFDDGQFVLPVGTLSVMPSAP